MIRDDKIKISPITKDEGMENKMKNKFLSILLIGAMVLVMAACGETSEESAGDLSNQEVVDLGTSLDVLDAIYETADLESDLREQVDNGNFQQAELDETIEAMFLGGASVSYVNGAVSAPMMSSVAYQVVVLQIEDGQDVEVVKKELVDTADTGKWVCVVPESVVAESNGNYILFLMTDSVTADALVEAFLAL